MLFLFSFVFAVPPELEPWVEWVRPLDAACPRVGDTALCAWPASWALDASPTQGRFTMQVRVDQAGGLPLPGGAGAWPQDVRADGQAVVVLDVAGVPTAVLSPGSWTLTGRYDWPTLPQGIAIPPSLGVVGLRIDGVSVPFPRVDAGMLRLGAGESEGGGSLEVDVSRLITDGVPARVSTRIALRASGSAREVDFGRVLPASTLPIQVQAELPVRLSAEDALIVQVRPGTWNIDVDAIYQGPLTALTAPTLPAPWPEVEFWAVDTNDTVRAVTLSGPAGVDAGRTPLPEPWRGKPTFRVEPGQTLAFTELRRGEPQPPPDQLSLRRELWLDQDGEGWSILDHFGGTLRRTWRLDAVPPGVLGRVTVGGDGQVITTGPEGQTGVELRQAELTMEAESRVEAGTLSLPAVGWAAEVQQLSATLHLPPGWTLLHASGADSAPNSLLSRLSLWDALFVGAGAVLISQGYGLVAGGLTALGLALTRDAGVLGAWTWLLLIGAALLRWGGPRIARLRRGLLIGLGLLLGVIGYDHLIDAVFPQLPGGGLSLSRGEDENVQELNSRMVDLMVEQKASSGRSKYLSVQYDPKAVVQTGSGLPSWQGELQSLSWSGSVSPDQRLQLYLLSPTANALLTLLQLVLLASVLRKLGGVRGGIAGLLVLALLPQRAEAAPTPELLEELKTRITATPCAADCVNVPRTTLLFDGSSLTLTAEVHAARLATWPIPGPVDTWMPSAVSVDGATAALARPGDGFIHVRLEPGVHTVVVRGQLPAGGLPLQFGLPTRQLQWSGPGWTVDGVRGDGAVERSVQLIQQAAAASSDGALRPYLEVHRFLDLGFPWRVQTEVRRLGPADRPLTLKVPLLAGESVNDERVQVRDGHAQVSLGREDTKLSWVSTLVPVEQLSLTAPADVPWAEVWELSCSPVYACTFNGPPPLQHVQDSLFSPLWRPWPGETVTIAVRRPDAASGQTITIDDVRSTWSPGPRQDGGRLELRVRTSQGGSLPVTLPEGAELIDATIDGVLRPLQSQKGQVELPLHTGEQQLALRWRRDGTPGLWAAVPVAAPQAPAVNVRQTVDVPAGMVALGVLGVSGGPVSDLLIRLLWVVVGGLALGRARVLGQGTTFYLLLGLGLASVPLPVYLLVVALLLGLWALRPVPPPFQTLLRYLLAPGASALLVLVLLLVVWLGLVDEPNPGISGGGSTSRTLHWYRDRVAEGVPSATVVMVPLWVWRVGLLIWAMWLLAQLPSLYRSVRDHARQVGLWP